MSTFYTINTPNDSVDFSWVGDGTHLPSVHVEFKNHKISFFVVRNKLAIALIDKEMVRITGHCLSMHQVDELHRLLTKRDLDLGTKLMCYPVDTLVSLPEETPVCIHEPIDVGFTHSKWVCKKCNIDVKPIESKW